MKKLSSLFLLVSIIIGCSSKKQTINVNNQTYQEVEVTIPCSGAEFRSDEKYFRASGIGESPNHAGSKEKSLLNAKVELRSNIETKIKQLTDRYTIERGINNKNQFEERTESGSKAIVEGSVQDISVVCEKTFKTSEGLWKVYTAIEMSKENLFEKAKKVISDADADKIDQDQEKFWEKAKNEFNN